MAMATAVAQGVIFLVILGSRNRKKHRKPQRGRVGSKVAIQGCFLVM